MAVGPTINCQCDAVAAGGGTIGTLQRAAFGLNVRKIHEAVQYTLDARILIAGIRMSRIYLAETPET